jgi:hypothetical protein
MVNGTDSEAFNHADLRLEGIKYWLIGLTLLFFTNSIAIGAMAFAPTWTARLIRLLPLSPTERAGMLIQSCRITGGVDCLTPVILLIGIAGVTLVILGVALMLAAGLVRWWQRRQRQYS